MNRNIVFCISLFSLVSMNAISATLWSLGQRTVKAVHTNVYGDLTFQISSPITTPCGVSDWVALPKTVPANGYVVPDPYLARIEAQLLHAMATSKPIDLPVITDWGCMWGTLPIILGITIFN